MGRARPAAGTGVAWARLGLLSKEGIELIRNGTFLINGFVYGHIGRLETQRRCSEGQTWKEMKLEDLPANSLAGDGFMLPTAQTNSQSQGTHAFFLSRRAV